MGAFELIDYALYCYAIFIFCEVTVANVHPFNSLGVGAPYLAIALMFLSVLLRNYMVMRAIDRHDVTHDGRLDFLSVLDRKWSTAERTVRLAIIFAVVATPRGTFRLATETIESVAGALSSRLQNSLGTASIRHVGHDTSMHSSLNYYSVVLFVLCFTSFVWDIVVTFGCARAVSAHKIGTEIDFKEERIPDNRYRAILRYYNICEQRKWGATDPSQISFKTTGFHKPKRRAALLTGQMGQIYLTSPKLLERILGLTVAVLVFLFSAAEFSPFATGALFISVGFYLLYAFRNEAYLRSLLSFLLIWITYLRGWTEVDGEACQA